MKKNRFLLAALSLVLACALCLAGYQAGLRAAGFPAGSDAGPASQPMPNTISLPASGEGVNPNAPAVCITYYQYFSFYVHSYSPGDSHVAVSAGFHGTGVLGLPLEKLAPVSSSGKKVAPEDLRYGDELSVQCEPISADDDTVTFSIISITVMDAET